MHFFSTLQTLRSQTIKCLTQKPKFCSQKSKCWSHVQMQTKWFHYKRSLLLTADHNYERHLSFSPLRIYIIAFSCLFNIYSQQLEACIKSVLSIFTFIAQTFTSFIAELSQFLGGFPLSFFFLVMLREVSHCFETVCYLPHVCH